MTYVQPAFNVVCVVGILFLLLVAQMAEFDRPTRPDGSLRWMRRLSFYAMALVLVGGIITDLRGWWEPNTFMTAIVAAGDFMLIVDWAVLSRRQQSKAPPPLPGALVPRGLSSDATRRRGPP